MSATPRFRLDRELGAGTSGVVWHGVLTEGFGRYPAGFEVAVKIQRPELARDERAAAMFAAEAEAGSAVAHPGIVHALGSGSDARGRWLVMPYVSGKTLREAQREERGPLPEPLVRGIARQVAGGLAALHAAGFAHGDVKPENVRLDAEGNAVLLDLGFAHRPGSERAREVAARPGSLAYVAPEQARGESGGFESDVFALGVVLYELVTSVHPFARAHDTRGGSSGVVARAALEKGGADDLLATIATARTEPASRHVPQITPFLDRALADALQRDPARRPAARDLAERFQSAESGPWWRALVASEALARDESDGRHLAPLVGREREIAALQEAFDRAVRTPEEGASFGGAVWLVGAEGTGKTRIVAELAARVRTSDDPPLFLYGRCRELEEERPAHAVLRMLERWLRLPANVAAGPRERAELERVVPPSVAETLAQALDPQFRGQTPLSVPVALAVWLARLGRTTPLLVDLDDVNWAGPDTLAVLSLAAEELRGARTLLVLGRRKGGSVRSPSAFAFLEERVATHLRARSIALEALGEDAILELVRALFHHSAPRLRLAHVLWERSRGNPGLAAEIVRALVARGDATPHPEGGGLQLFVAPDDLPLPGSLQRAIGAAYKGLPALERLWLRRLAVVGGRIETEFLLQAFPPAKRSEVDGVLSSLVRSGWLESQGDRYRFARPALRAALYKGLSREQRAKLHARAADALKRPSDEHAALEDDYQRAFHLRAAGRHEELVEVLTPLLERLGALGQSPRIFSLAQWGLEALDALPKTRERQRLRIALLESAADAADRLGIRAEQRAFLDQLADLEIDSEEDPLSMGRVYLLHARYAVSTGQYGLARGMLRNASELFEKAGARLERSEALRRWSLVQSHVGELAEARALADEALEIAFTRAQEALAHLALGVIDVLEDRLESALAHADAALASLKKDTSRQRPGVHAAAHLLRARYYRSTGAPGRALASAKRAVDLARTAGERRLEAEALARLGQLNLDVARPEEAQAQLREALRLASEIEDRRGQALARTFLGILLWEDDDPEAEPMLARALELGEEMGLNRLVALVCALRARIEMLQRRDHAAALEWSARGLALLDRYGAEVADRIVIAGTRALVLEASGMVDEARELRGELERRLARESALLRSPLLRLRRSRVAERLLAGVLSGEGTIYPRVPLDPSAAG